MQIYAQRLTQCSYYYRESQDKTVGINITIDTNINDDGSVLSLLPSLPSPNIPLTLLP